jgi:hypothetical protein
MSTELTAETIAQIRAHGLSDSPELCKCKHQLQGTGGVFYQGIMVLYCINCRGFQSIRKPIR